MKIYEEIEEALIVLLNDITVVKHTDVYNMQYENTETDDPIKYPAVFVEILDPVDWKQMGNETQTGTMRIKLHCVSQSLKKDKSKVLSVSQAVFEAIQNKELHSDNDQVITSTLQRVQTSSPKRAKNLKIIHITFQCQAYDFSMVPELTEVELNFKVNR